MAAEYEKPQAEDEAEESNDRQSRSGKNGGLETEVIYFKDPTGRLGMYVLSFLSVP